MKNVIIILAVLILSSCKENRCTEWENLNADSAKADFSKGKYRLFKEWHGCDSTGSFADTLIKHYQIQLELVEDGCVEEDGISAYEDEMILQMEKINGKGWYERYGFLLDSIGKAVEEAFDEAYQKQMDENKNEIEKNK